MPAFKTNIVLTQDSKRVFSLNFIIIYSFYNLYWHFLFLLNEFIFKLYSLSLDRNTRTKKYLKNYLVNLALSYILSFHFSLRQLVTLSLQRSYKWSVSTKYN